MEILDFSSYPIVNTTKDDFKSNMELIFTWLNIYPAKGNFFFFLLWKNIQLSLPSIDCEKIKHWIVKLCATDIEESIRNDYVWFLLAQLDSGKLDLPFLKKPPEDRLKPLIKSVVLSITQHWI